MMATAPPKDPDKPWRWGESKVPGIVVHTEENDGATTFPAPLRLDLGKTSAAPPLRKSPVTVQEWIDSLPHPETEEEPSRTEETDVPVSETPETNDTFVLGAEAVHLAQTRPPSIVVDGPPVTMSPRENGLQEEQHPTRREQFSRARTTERMASFASDSAASNASSGGSHHSVESFLESRKLDPERILLNLGFGGSQDSSGELGLSRIPQRFLQPSQVKGISIADFYRHEMNMAQTFETGFYGYRGLTGQERPLRTACSSPTRPYQLTLAIACPNVPTRFLRCRDNDDPTTVTRRSQSCGNRAQAKRSSSYGTLHRTTLV